MRNCKCGSEIEDWMSCCKKCYKEGIKPKQELIAKHIKTGEWIKIGKYNKHSDRLLDWIGILKLVGVTYVCEECD